MFDLPTGSKAERKSYTEFRKFLIEDGYQMEQFSVYSRIVLSRESMKSHLDRLRANLPVSGIVTVMQLTEKQFESREILVNSKSSTILPDLGAQLTLVF